MISYACNRININRSIQFVENNVYVVCAHSGGEHQNFILIQGASGNGEFTPRFGPKDGIKMTGDRDTRSGSPTVKIKSGISAATRPKWYTLPSSLRMSSEGENWSMKSIFVVSKFKFKFVKAEIITIGDEILIGQIVDTNSAWLGTVLNEEGIEVTRINSISDTPEAIIEALEGLYSETQLVIMTGGLGPTKDDLTKQTLAKYFSSEMVFRQDVWEHIVELFKGFGREPVERNKQQAFVPEACEVLFNHKGTAPGMLFRKGEVRIVSLPGVPYEMKGLVNNELLPLLREEIDYQIIHKTLFVVGVPESVLADKIEPFEFKFPNSIKLAYLPRPGMVRLRLTSRGKRSDDLRRDIDAATTVLRKALGDDLDGRFFKAN